MKKISTFLLIFCTQIGVACDCPTTLIDLPVKEMGWTLTETDGVSSISDIIFTGVLVDARKVEETYLNTLFYEDNSINFELIFKLIKSYKGDKSDTIKIRTNRGPESCGFVAKKNSTCLIFGMRGHNGYYYTYRGDCCKSMSKEEDEKRYNKYIKFMESLTNMTDGAYVFYQSKDYWSSSSADTLEAIRYTIKNGKLEGTWQIKDRNGRVLEKGVYKNGKKIGIWKVISYTRSDLDEADEQIRMEKIHYKNGKPRRSVTGIEDKAFVWERTLSVSNNKKTKNQKKI